MDDDVSARVKLRKLDVLSDNYYTLRNAHFEFRRRDGTWQTQARESYDPGGDGAAVLPIDPARRQGSIDRVSSAGQRLREWLAPTGDRERLPASWTATIPRPACGKEAMEEAGVRIFNLRRMFHCFMSPGAVKERLSLFLADYDSTEPRGQGGGHAEEGEDIDVLELTLDQALAMVAAGEIVDAKTIMLLQAAKLRSGLSIPAQARESNFHRVIKLDARRPRA